MCGIQIRLAYAASAALLIAAVPATGLAQQNLPPKPGALVLAETPHLKADKMLAAGAVTAGADATASP